MSRKLTEDQQEAILKLSKLLGKVLPAKSRSMAGGISSSLVRLNAERLDETEVMAILKKYSAGADSFAALKAAGVLVPGADDEPGYLLRVPGLKDAVEASEAAQGQMQAQHQNKASGQHSTIPSPQTKAASPSPTATQAIAKTPKGRSLAKRGPHGLSGLTCTRKQTPELNDLRRQIIDLDPRLWINGWLLSAPEAYTRYERELKALDAALANGLMIGDGSLTQRELSYKIFGDEKFLSIDSDGRKLLQLLGLADVVSVKQPHKLPLAHHIPRWKHRMRLVVSENLDPWSNMRELMYREGAKRILGVRVHGIVFGDGSIVADPHKLPELVASLDAEEVEILYWGDIDRAGLSTLTKVAQMAEETGAFTVQPFAEAYHAMLKRAMARFEDPLQNEPCDQEKLPVEGLDLIEPLLKPKEAAYLRAVVKGCRLIPQEILTKKDL